MRYLLKWSFLLVLFATGCKTIAIQQETQKTTVEQVALASVGVDNNLLLKNNYTNTAIPELIEPIKVSITVMPFTKKTINAFNKANTLAANTIAVTYIDSLESKPKFANIYIADKVTLLKALNNKTNSNVKDYLRTKNQAKLVNQITIAFNVQTLNDIAQADECFLEQEGIKSYALQLYKNGKKTQRIKFSEGVVFAYKTLNPCWKQNKKYKLDIVDLVSGKNRCPSNTTKKASRAKKEINYFKL